ncbi:hypothetical protein V6N13_081358 [Hibiscus sabdariffa]
MKGKRAVLLMESSETEKKEALLYREMGDSEPLIWSTAGWGLLIGEERESGDDELMMAIRGMRAKIGVGPVARANGKGEGVGPM